MPLELSKLREVEFSSLKTMYFNTAFMGPTPTRTQDRLKKTVDQFSDPSFMAYEWLDFLEVVRGRIASLLDVSSDNVSINASTSDVISNIALGFRFNDAGSANETVALLEGEYPSDVLPWLHYQKNRVKFYSRDLLNEPKKFVASLHANTRILNLSHVSFQTGDMVDLHELNAALRGRQIFTILDVTQSLGGLQIPLQDRSQIDVIVCSPYKWLLSPYGQAFSVWSNRAVDLVMPSHVGWMTMPQAPRNLTQYTTDFKVGARRFDRGQAPNILGLNGLDESLSLFGEVGLLNIEKHNAELRDYFLQNFPKNKYRLLTSTERKGNILCLRAEGVDSDVLQKRLRASNIDVSVREGNLRLSFHMFNTRGEVDRLLSCLAT